MHQFPVHTELADGSISDNYYNRIKPTCSLPPVIGSNTSFIDNDNKTQTRSARPPHVRVSCLCIQYLPNDPAAKGSEFSAEPTCDSQPHSVRQRS